jgi:hypothetical protein
MKAKDLLIMTQILFEMNTMDGIRNRAMLVLQWQLFGRIHEVASLLMSDLHVFEGDSGNNKCLQVRFFWFIF